VTHERAPAIRNEVGFFQAVRAAFGKRDAGLGQNARCTWTRRSTSSSPKRLTPRVWSISLRRWGGSTPDISILSDEDLSEVRDLPHRAPFAGAPGEAAKAPRSRRVLAERAWSRGPSGSDSAQALIAYQNRSTRTDQIIAQLIDLAKEMQAARRRGEELGPCEEELAFYDAARDER
jgi:type I restriction enzyme, R subunit